VTVTHSLEAALEAAREAGGETFIAGGAQIYELALPLATDQILTEVHTSPVGDTHYPAFDESEWSEFQRESHLEHVPAYEIRWLRRTA
jgi:dihydrofolate reductase